MLRHLVISIATAFVLTAIGLYAGYSTSPFWKWPFHVLLWPSALLAAQIPLHNIGTADHPVFEGTPLHFLAFIAGSVLAFLFYALGTFGVLRVASRRTSRRP